MDAHQHIGLIAALDTNGLIGNGNALPWQLPNDMAYFKKTTMGKPVLMGRTTFEAIGRPLPGRRNLILSRNRAFNATGCEVFPDIRTALTQVALYTPLMVIGGAAVYAAVLDTATHLYLTRIHHAFAGDTYFPRFDPDAWQEISNQPLPADECNAYRSTRLVLRRRGVLGGGDVHAT
ncbi:MAG: dihydrofolate reductase [Gammaproteobacteria bacterium]|nr:dihydrofolate reductase [Gammaproteobacteria bacterium]